MSFLPLLLASIAVDYVAGDRLARARGAAQRKRWLVLSIAVNLGILAWFKYGGFLTLNLRALFDTEGIPLIEAALPIGISFYTFQSMSYTIDVYRGAAPPVKSFSDFSCFVSLFPQLIAGPIVRYNTVAEQLASRAHSLTKFTSGTSVFILGFAKKILLANPMGEVADAVFSAESLTAADAWFGIVAYAFQIYFDFSGYSDMAIGLGRMLGFEFPKNFNAPYLADSITDFWRRWHISLSTWLKEHLYIPLGGNRHGTAKTYRNLMLTMLLGGLWHGAGWNFVTWGGLHGLYLAVHKLWMSATSRTVDAARGVLRKLIGGLVTFHLVCLAWIFFRAANEKEQGPLRVAWQVIEGIGKCEFKPTDQVPWTAMLLIPVALMIDYLSASRNRQLPLDARTPLFFRGLVYGSAVVMILLANSSGDVPFIYFRF